MSLCIGGVWRLLFRGCYIFCGSVRGSPLVPGDASTGHDVGIPGSSIPPLQVAAGGHSQKGPQPLGHLLPEGWGLLPVCTPPSAAEGAAVDPLARRPAVCPRLPSTRLTPSTRAASPAAARSLPQVFPETRTFATPGASSTPFRASRTSPATSCSRPSSGPVLFHFVSNAPHHLDVIWLLGIELDFFPECAGCGPSPCFRRRRPPPRPTPGGRSPPPGRCGRGYASAGPRSLSPWR